MYGTLPLPYSLDGIGMTGCTLNISPDAVAWANVVGTTGTVSLPIPNSSQLLGTTFFQQAFAVVPGANPLNVVATLSKRGTVGRQ